MIPAIFEHIKDYSDIDDQSILQIIEILPSENENDVIVVNLSDGQYWVTTALNQDYILFESDMYFTII